jgi:hypothetical protein
MFDRTDAVAVADADTVADTDDVADADSCNDTGPGVRVQRR